MKKSKKILSIILAFAMVITMVLPVFAENYATSGTCGENVTWEFDVPTRTLTISGEGEMYDGWFNEESPWSTYKSIIKTVVIEDGVTYIGWYSFQEHTALTNIIFTDSVMSIGNHAFENCTALSNIVLPHGITIGSYAFEGCSSLKDVTFRDGSLHIFDSAFQNCDSLENIYINNLCNWLWSYFEDECSNPLRYADNLYLNGELVTELVIPEDVTSIKDYTFYNYDKLESVKIHENVGSISETAFRYCTSLSEINVDENNETFKSIDGVLLSSNMIALLQYPAQKTDEAYTIPDNVLILKDYAFYDNDYLKEVIIPETVATVGEFTFYDCDGLTSITIPDEVVSIGNCAFYGCEKLDTVVMGSGITSIGDSAFSYYDSWDKLIAPDLYYNGTEEMWDSVSGGYDYYFNNIHYNCTNPDGHYTLTKVVNPSTCRDEGYSEYTCPCGYTIQKDYTYLDHTPGDWNISQYPTCTKTGHKYQRCTGCGVWLNDESIPATGHIAGEWQSIAPTCTESGLEGKCCTECGELIEGEIVAALGGSHTFGEWTMVDNRQSRTCSTCGYIEYMKVAGDLNGDGYTSAKEARIILQCVAGLIDIESELKDTADVNYDGKISAVDARIVLQMVAGLREPEDGWNIISYDKSTIDPDAPAVSSLTVSTDKTSVIVGEIVFVTVTLDNKSGISALTTIANYDSSILKPIEMKAGNLGATVNVNTGVATMAAAETFETSGTICTMTFQALKTGSADITFDIIEACDSDMSDVNLNVNTVKITVGEESTTEPEEPSIEPGTCANGHNYTWYTISVVTCETDGVMLGECTVCGATDVKATLKTGHNIVDGVCQNCGYTENGENDNTNTDDNENVGNEDNNNEEVTDPSENCSCNCHKSGISNFFFKIGLFFQKIFGSNKYCGCGVAHY